MRMRTALLFLAATLAGKGIPARAADDDAKVDRRPAAAAPAASARETGAPAGGEGETFEALARSAQPIGDPGAVLGALVDKCPEEKRGIDRARCRAALTFLRHDLPERSFAITVTDAAAISVSPYDDALNGYRIGMAGCVACTSPVRVGRATEPVFVTLKKPAEAGKADEKPAAAPGPEETLATAVEIASAPLAFSSSAEARRWLDEVRPHLRADVIFSATASEWRFPTRGSALAARGYALGLVAGRIVDGCTGAVIVSVPPSTGLAERTPPLPGTAAAGCPAPTRAAATATGPAGSAASTGGDDDEDEVQLPSELSRTVISDVMGGIRAQVNACVERYRVAGAAPLTFEVAGDGSLQSVHLAGALSGTPTGDCVVEAARGARFPRFDGAIQTFTYPFFLRR